MNVRNYIIAFLCITSFSLVCFQYADVIANLFTGSNQPTTGYFINNSTINQQFFNGAGPFKIGLANNNASYSLSSNGLRITPNAANGLIYIMPQKITNATTVSMHIKDLQCIDANHTGHVQVVFGLYNQGDWYYELDIYFYGNQRFGLYPNCWLGNGTKPVKGIEADYNSDDLNILIRVLDGVIRCGINGIDYDMPINFTGGYWNDLYLENITLGSDDHWTSASSFNVTSIAVSASPYYRYQDRLHKTITPWGHDFTYSTQFHADYTNPEHLALLAELTKKYGFKGEFSCWMTADPNAEYSVETNQTYKERVLALQSLGWNISVHSVSESDLTRNETLSLIAEFENIFGRLRSWVDHGELMQDIWQQGNNKSSPYYIADYLSKNDIMIWVNQEFHSHSKGMDLNKDQVFYHYASYPGLNLEKVSRDSIFTFFDNWDSRFAPVTVKDMDNRLRAFAAESSVINLHDYTMRYFYEEFNGKKYTATINASSMGYPYEVMSDDATKWANLFPGGKWHTMEPVLVLLDAMAAYDVWHATPRQIWDRARYVQNVTIDESATDVTITNPSQHVIEGLTLTTVSKPNYALSTGGKRLYPIKGARNWHFVINETPTGSTVLKKV